MGLSQSQSSINQEQKDQLQKFLKNLNSSNQTFYKKNNFQFHQQNIKTNIFNGKKDQRIILKQKNCFIGVGQMIAINKLGTWSYGSCSLIKLQLPDSILNQVQRHTKNNQNYIYLILTCAHNVSEYLQLEKRIQRVVEIMALFGKQQNLTIKQQINRKLESSISFCIGEENIFVHSNFKGGNLDGHDIALVGINKDHYHYLNEFNQYQEQQKTENQLPNYFEQTDLFRQFQEAVQNGNAEDYMLGVVGYPAEENFKNKNYPQVMMFQEIKELKLIQDGKIIPYDKIQTSEGQSGSGVILKHKDKYQQIGVHTGYENGNNLAFFIGPLTYDNLSQIFSQGQIFQQSEFDEFLVQQVKIQNQSFIENEYKIKDLINSSNQIFKKDPQISDQASKKFKSLGPIKLYLDLQNDQDIFERKWEIQQIENIKIEGFGSYWNYNGMVCSQSQKPHGFGRAIEVYKSCFYDGMFKDGVFYGAHRFINFDGQHYDSPQLNHQ